MRADQIVSADGGDHVAMVVGLTLANLPPVRALLHLHQRPSLAQRHLLQQLRRVDRPSGAEARGFAPAQMPTRESCGRKHSAWGRQLAAHRMAWQLRAQQCSEAAPQHCYIAGAAPHHCYITGASTGLSRPERAGADLLKVKCVHGPKGASEVQSVSGGECLGSGVRGHAIVQRHDEAHRDELGLVVAGRQWPCGLGQRRCQQQQRREQECTSGHGGAVVQNGLVDCTNWLWGRLERFAVRMGGGGRTPLDFNMNPEPQLLLFPAHCTAPQTWYANVLGP